MIIDKVTGFARWLVESVWPVESDNGRNRLTGSTDIYQLDFITPGSLPCEANVRKQMRQIPNFRK
jgi:hypothetical protein